MTGMNSRTDRAQLFQLTSSRRGWRTVICCAGLNSVISTHILTKRMTLMAEKIRKTGHISTHILTKRMTPPSCHRTSLRGHFNSHPHEEDDESVRRRWRSSKNFNSHPHEEDDGKSILTRKMRGYFNSHPHEEDDFFFFTCGLFGLFQLTSSRRGWRPLLFHMVAREIFQLTSSRRGWQAIT